MCYEGVEEKVELLNYLNLLINVETLCVTAPATHTPGVSN